MTEFIAFPKIPRLKRDIVITEKIDGTNASIYVGEDGEFLVGSRTRWITPDNDNYGFARWAYDHEDELRRLGIGHHFGEWWGQGIQRRYDITRKVFSLFNVGRWAGDPNLPDCCEVVPIMYQGPYLHAAIEGCLQGLKETGSLVAPGFMNPEGIVIYHSANRALYKVTIEKDDQPKSLGQ